MSENGLLEEINDLPKPDNFELVRIDHLLNKYFDEGSSRSSINSKLENYGFSVFERVRDSDDPDFDSCDELISIGTYDVRESFFPVAGYKVVIYVGFKNDLSSVLKGYYLKHMY